MDEWRIQQQQQQQHRMISGGVGPVLSYHPARSRASPYPTTHQMSELKQSYQYQTNSSNTSTNPLSPATSATTPNPSTASISVTNDTNDTTSSSLEEVSTTTPNSDVYTPNNTNSAYTPAQMEQIQQQQRIMTSKSSIGPIHGYHSGQQQMMAARARSTPYPLPPSHQHHPHHHPSMYPHPSGPVCQCPQHMHQNNGQFPMHPSQHPMYYHQQQQQQQQQEAWYRYQQQQAAWRQHHMQQQQHLQSHSQPVPIEQSYNAILSDTSSITKLKAAKTKTKKKQNNIPTMNDESLVKYPPMPPSSLNLSIQHQQQQRACIPPPPSANYYPSVYSTPNPYIPAQQLPPQSSTMSQEHLMYTQTSPPTFSHHQSQIFTSPLSNPSTPHQMHTNGEYNGTAEFGVPYHHGAPGSVNSLTDALCPGGDTTDRQMTPGPPSVGTPRVAPLQYSFPHTPLTPQTINNQNTNPHTPVMMPPTPNPLSAPPTPLTRPRSSGDQTQSIINPFQQYEQNKSVNNVDDLAAYLKDPTNLYLTDDVSSTLFDDIDALADTYLGQQSNNQQQPQVDQNSAEDILLSFLCSDDLTS